MDKITKLLVSLIIAGMTGVVLIVCILLELTDCKNSSIILALSWIFIVWSYYKNQ